MSDNDKESWSAYAKLVLDQLERLTDNYDSMKSELEKRFQLINDQLNEVKNLKRLVDDHKEWIKEVNDVWSPTQMKEGKDEIYKHKTKLDIAMAIVIFVQILIGIGVAIAKNIPH